MSRWMDWIVVIGAFVVAFQLLAWHDRWAGVALAIAYSAGRWDERDGWRYAEARTRERDARRRARERLRRQP